MKHFTVEITSRCNLSCRMCLQQSWREPFGDMDIDTFRSLLPLFPALDSLNLSGYGEPFLHPHLTDIIGLARKWLPTTAKIELTTNGTLIDRSTARAIMKAGLDSITLSIDSLDHEQFQSIRKDADLDSVTGALEILLGEREKANGRPFHVGVSVVAMERNFRELPHLVRSFAGLGVDGIWINNVLPPSEEIAREVLHESHSDLVLSSFASVKEKFYESGVNPRTFPLLVQRAVALNPYYGLTVSRNLSKEEKGLLEFYQRAVSEVISAGADFSILRLLEKDGSRYAEYLSVFEECSMTAALCNVELHLPLLIPKTRRECAFIRGESCFVTWDGWVRPCYQCSHDYTCFHHGRKKKVESISFGKVPDETLETIWESYPYQNFRKTVKEFPFPPCGDCGVVNSCGLISHNSDFYYDCFANEQPCGDCLWSQGILQCPS